MRSAPLTLVATTLLIGLCGALYYWTTQSPAVQLQNHDPAPQTGDEVAPTLAVPAARREPSGRGEDDTTSRSEQPGSTPRDPATTDAPSPRADAFPPEYTGIRDPNLLRIYKVFRVSLDRQEQILGTASEEQLAMGADEDYLQKSAYLALIQSQRLHYYGYEPAPQSPPNTEDVEYHLTGGGGMSIVFELTRAEFPDLFAAKDRQRKAAGDVPNGGR